MAEWFGIAITAVGFIVTVSVMWGKLTTRMEMSETRLKAHSEQHKEHYAHAADLQRHWTERERDGQTKQLDRIEELIQELLTERADCNRYRPPNGA